MTESDKILTTGYHQNQLNPSTAMSLLTNPQIPEITTGQNTAGLHSIEQTQLGPEGNVKAKIGGHRLGLTEITGPLIVVEAGSDPSALERLEKRQCRHKLTLITRPSTKTDVEMQHHLLPGPTVVKGLGMNPRKVFLGPESHRGDRAHPRKSPSLCSLFYSPPSSDIRRA